MMTLQMPKVEEGDKLCPVRNFPWYEELPHTKRYADTIIGDLRRVGGELRLDCGGIFCDGDEIFIVGTGGYLPEVPAFSETSGAKGLAITAADGDGHFIPWWDSGALNNDAFWQAEINCGIVTVKRTLAQPLLRERLETGNHLPDVVMMMQMLNLNDFPTIYDIVGKCAGRNSLVFIFSGGIGYADVDALAAGILQNFPSGYDIKMNQTSAGSYAFPGGHHVGIIYPKGMDIFNDVE